MCSLADAKDLTMQQVNGRLFMEPFSRKALYKQIL